MWGSVRQVLCQEFWARVANDRTHRLGEDDVGVDLAARRQWEAATFPHQVVIPLKPPRLVAERPEQVGIGVREPSDQLLAGRGIRSSSDIRIALGEILLLRHLHRVPRRIAHHASEAALPAGVGACLLYTSPS